MKNSQKGFVIPIIIAAIALLALGGGYVYYQSNSVKTIPTSSIPDVVSNVPTNKNVSDRSSFQTQDQQNAARENVRLNSEGLVACTKDAKQCPDGSYVGRSGPNCEFVCPNQGNVSFARTFLEKMQKELGLDYKIVVRNLNIDFPSGQTRETAVYSFYPSLNVSIDQYLAKNLVLYDGGDATFRGYVAYKNDLIICRRYSEIINGNSFTEIRCADIDNKQTEIFNVPPPLGDSTLRISCGLEEIPGCTDITKNTCSYMTKCNTEGVNSTRSDFYLIVDGARIKILVDIETRLRFTMGPNETLQKWADFYPYIQSHLFGGGMPFGATIYGDWINENTFKANWIKWTVG